MSFEVLIKKTSRNRLFEVHRFNTESGARSAITLFQRAGYQVICKFPDVQSEETPCFEP